MLEVIMRDSLYNRIYKNEIEVKNVKELAKLMSDLKDKGVPIEKAIKVQVEDDFW